MSVATVGRTTALFSCLAIVVALTAGATTPGLASTDSGSTPSKAPSAVAVTLVTGDVVEVSTAPDGQQSATLRPSPDGSIPQAAISEVAGHLYVVPTVAFGLLSSRQLDRGLFDVTSLIASDYDDSSRDTLPVLVDYGQGAVAAQQARSASLAAAQRTVVVPSLGIAAFHADKQDARQFWADLTKGADAAGSPTSLTDGAARVELDGRVSATLEDSVPQIHAPEAWAAGYDGKGVKVAVLDTGYDATHPDLQNQVIGSANFSTDPSVVDGNGHGTHVASTIAGTGAASAGLRTGVAPEADLLVGKVLGDDGYGEDSQVLAGMQWAVAQHADIVSMSLGGDTTDGSDPLSRAVDELSKTSDTLFVVAAGNNGYNGSSTITSPGAAADALTVGAVDVNDSMAGFSSRGPTFGAFGLKPEIVAPGVDVTAARAAGTSLGDPVDQYYTTLSGTSMATPHVAGVAAILKEKHPAWDGERLKAAIANSAVPIDNATDFDAGTGRVDALRAIQQKVVAPASLSLGAFRWPYGTLDPKTTPLTYKNTAGKPVTLSLALAGEDGTPDTSGAMSLGTDTVTVPAHRKASVDVTVDPTIAAADSYSAVVTATPNRGHGTVRTAVGYQLEPERYDLTIEIRPRAGEVNASHDIGLSGYDTGTYDSRTLDAAPGTRSVTFRVAPGRYSTGAVSFGLANDGAHEGAVTYNPSFSVTKDTTIVLDENLTKQFTYEADRPVVNDGAILDITWNGPAGYTGFTFYGAVDRLYALPTDGGSGAVATAASNWLLTQPEGLLTPEGGTPVALRPVTAGAQYPWQVDLAPLDEHLRIVNAGSSSHPRTAKVKGAIAVVSNRCTDLTSAVKTLQKARAAAVVAFPADGSACAGTLPTAADVPVLQARPYDVSALLAARPRTGRLVTHSNPSYMYDLVHFWPDSVPNGGTVSGIGNSVATINEQYNGMGTTSADGLSLIEELYGWVPARGGVANIGLVYPVDFPSTVTHYVSTGAAWERTVEITDAQYGGEYARLWEPQRVFKGGTTTNARWFGGPISFRVSPLSSMTNGSPPPVREGDEMFFSSSGAFDDSAGHLGQSDVFSNEYRGRLWEDGHLILDMFASAFMNTAVSPGRHHYYLETNVRRKNLFWQHSTQIKSAWTFTSNTPSGARDVIPLLSANFGMPLSNTGNAPAGRFNFNLKFSLPNELQTLPTVQRKLQISWNHGDTWHHVDLTKHGDTSYTAHVVNRPGKTASLRVSATDSGGHTLRQKVVDAYGVAN